MSNKVGMKYVGRSRECRKCSENKDLSLFPTASDCLDGRKWTCRVCINSRRSNIRLEDPNAHNSKRRDYTSSEVGRSSYLNKQFGITLNDYNVLFEYQGGLCAVCRKPEVQGRSLSVDHCHTTLEIRGLLCRNCNLGIGHFKDDWNLLIKAACYLNFSEDNPKVGPASKAALYKVETLP